MGNVEEGDDFGPQETANVIYPETQPLATESEVTPRSIRLSSAIIWYARRNHDYPDNVQIHQPNQQSRQANCASCDSFSEECDGLIKISDREICLKEEPIPRRIDTHVGQQKRSAVEEYLRTKISF